VTAATSSDEQRDTLVRALGGRRGLLDSGLPGVLFVTVYTLTSLTPALWAAVAVGAVLTVARVVRRETLQHALAGFIGVAVAAFIAHRTGEARNFFLPGLFINAGYAAAYLLSIVVRWPLLGVVIGPLVGEGTAWRSDPDRRRAYTRATWVWVAMFVLRIAVQLPLYLAGAVVALGAARLAMGWPLFLAGAWVCYLVLRGVPLARPDDASQESSQESEEDPSGRRSRGQEEPTADERPA
jgi:hypothetical protein